MGLSLVNNFSHSTAVQLMSFSMKSVCFSATYSYSPWEVDANSEMDQ